MEELDEINVKQEEKAKEVVIDEREGDKDLNVENQADFSLIEFQKKLYEKTKVKNDKNRFIVFSLAFSNNKYIVNTKYVKKTGKIEKISKLGICHNWFYGLISLNSKMHAVIDIEKLLIKENVDLFEKQDKEIILFSFEDKELMINCNKIEGIVEESNLIPNELFVKENEFIKKEWLAKEETLFYKEIDIKKIMETNKLQQAFKGFV